MTTGTKQNVYPCNSCEKIGVIKIYKFKATLTHHINACHNRNTTEIHSCDLCGKIYQIKNLER